jgi:ribosomal protein L16 Arg81 hydroxylase
MCTCVDVTSSASTFQDLIAPLSEAEFLSLLRERRLKFVRGTNRNRYSTLLGWDALQRKLERGEHPRGVGDIRLTKESATIPTERWLTRNKADNTNKIDIGKLEEFLANGFSLVITPIDRHVPALEALCASIGSQTGEQIKVGVIVTACGTDGAFKIHFDPEDLIILQVEGTKRWKIFGPPVSNPVIGMPKQEAPPEDKPIFDEVLQPGDFLFLPAGTWHHCENGPGRSLHLGIFFIPPTSWHAVRNLTTQLVSDETLRTPLTRLADQAELDALEAQVKRNLVEKINSLDLKGFLGQWNTMTNA